MSRNLRRAAAWAAPVAANEGAATFKQTHKLLPMVCVLWLPDFGGYLKAISLSTGRFSVSPTPENAIRLGEDQAEAVGQDLIDRTGVRVHLRPYVQTH